MQYRLSRWRDRERDSTAGRCQVPLVIVRDQSKGILQGKRRVTWSFRVVQQYESGTKCLRKRLAHISKLQICGDAPAA
jgi:hypothetical protein